MRRFIQVALVVVSAALATACGMGEEQTEGVRVDDVKATMEKLLVAAIENDLETARPHLDVGGFLAQMGSNDAFEFDKLSKEEREAHTRAAFNQIRTIPNSTKIDDRGSILTALGTARISLASQTGTARVEIIATGDDGKPVTFICRLRKHVGGPTWFLVTCEPQYGR